MASGNIASPDLQWILLKKGHSFTHKRPANPFTFSAEKGNVRNIHAFKYSGLANSRTLDIAPSKSGKGVTLTSRKAKASPFAISTGFESQEVKGKSARKAAEAVATHSGTEAGRLDLRKSGFARASAIIASQSTRKAQRQRALRGNKAPAVSEE